MENARVEVFGKKKGIENIIKLSMQHTFSVVCIHTMLYNEIITQLNVFNFGDRIRKMEG